jgi:phospholipid-transporting ATPase
MLNSTKARAKRSKLESAMNKQIIIVFIFQLIFCLFSSLYGAVWYTHHSEELSYLEIDRNRAEDNSFAYNLIVRYGNWLIIFQNFVPISLMVTLEMVKFIQGIFISNDLKMKTKDTGTMASVHTSSLNEELGQVEYIFSDKTGTLTCNFMEFKKVSISGESYGEDRSLTQQEFEQKPKVSNVDFKDQVFFNRLKEGNKAIE